MRKTRYLVRHCQATGQAADAPLTLEGEQQAVRLAEPFALFPIDRIVSSPYLRATQSIARLAQRIGVSITPDDRLIERSLSTDALDDWRAALRSTFDDPDLTFAGGESSRAATQRAVEVVHEVLRSPARTTVLVTHGNLLTLLLRSFDPQIGFSQWQHLTNPDLYHLELEGVPPVIHTLARVPF